MACNNGIVIPPLSVDECDGERKSTKCIIHQTAIPLFELPINSTQEQINNAIVVAMNSLVNRVVALETLVEDLEERIEILENH